MTGADGAAGVDALSDWLVAQGLLATSTQDLVARTAARLNALGVPVARVHLAGTLLDPQFDAVSVTWTDAEGSKATPHPHGSDDSEDWLSSPLKWAVDGIGARVAGSGPTPPGASSLLVWERFCLRRGQGMNRFAVLRDFATEGYTDYLVFALPFYFDGSAAPNGGDGMVGSWMTDAEGGFSDDQVRLLRRITPLLALASRSHTFWATGHTVVATYLGRDAGHRVLTGTIRLGDVETISTAILLADLRGFTHLSETYERTRMIRTLNDYLACMVEPVTRNDGQVLKFLGDGLLASFAVSDNDRTSRCRAALAAAEQALERVDSLNRQRLTVGEPIMPLDLALHVGQVFYGNVGSERRLDFTVIGPAVNECSRMEAMCGPNGTCLIASSTFVAATGMASRFVSLGHQLLRGVEEPRELFTLVQYAPVTAGPP